MAKKYDLIGKRFGRLTVIAMAARQPGDRAISWSCLCDCGKTTTAFTGGLNYGHPSSCGCGQRDAAAKVCLDKTTHAMSGSRLYHIFRSMHQRCYYPRSISYPAYGGRGIRICEQWYKNFASFCSWALTNGYKDSLSIDRIDNNGNYEPANCRFTTGQSQSRNRRSNRLLTIGGVTRPLAEWADLSGIGPTTILYRIHARWPDDNVLMPSRAYGQKAAAS